MTPPYQVYIDFDNTISVGDVLDAVIERFATDQRWQQLEQDWVEGRIGARDCLDGQLRLLKGSPGEFEAFLAGVQLDPGFSRLVALLRQSGVQLTVVSDNFDQLIAAEVPLFANHVDYVEGGLVPAFPYYNPECPRCAHCKKTHFTPRRDARKVVYIGDGRSDICPATHADVVYAKSSLLQHLRQEKQSCRPFGTLDDVVTDLQIRLYEN